MATQNLKQRTLVSSIVLCAACVSPGAAQAAGQPAAQPPDPPSLRLFAAQGPSPSGIGIATSALPGETLELVTCEAVLDGNEDFGLYAVNPSEDEWKVEDGAWSYTWRFENGIELGFRAQPVGADGVEGEGGDALALEYTLTNHSHHGLARAHLHPCLPTVGAPSFFPGTAAQAQVGTGGRRARAGRHDFSELYGRLWLWSNERPFTFESSKSPPEVMHLAFLREGEAPIAWSWWQNAEERFDLPLIALASKSSKKVLALGFERAIWASSNVNDPRACIHLFPLFGVVPAGEKSTVRGRLYILDGGPEDARARFLRDFPRLRGARGG